MKYFKLINLPVSQYTTKSDIYALQIRIEDRTKYIVINYDTWYEYKNYSIEEAINHYLSDEGKMERYESWYRAWCD